MVNRNCRLLATWESVAKHLIDGALQHAEQCLQKNYLRSMKLLGHANWNWDVGAEFRISPDYKACALSLN